LNIYLFKNIGMPFLRAENDLTSNGTQSCWYQSPSMNTILIPPTYFPQTPFKLYWSCIAFFKYNNIILKLKPSPMVPGDLNTVWPSIK
jgi:hypothetical protein